MIKDKIQTEQDFSKIFVSATQNDEMIGLVNILNDMLAENPRNYLAWLYVARSYEDIGEADKAKNSYKQAYKFKPSEVLASEIQEFCERNNIDYWLSATKSIAEAKNDDKIEIPKSIDKVENKEEVEKIEEKQEISVRKESKLKREATLTEENNQAIDHRFNKIHKDVLLLQREQKFEEGLNILQKELQRRINKESESKYLMLIAQLFSAWGKYEDAEKAYLNLIVVNKQRKYDKKNNNLSHLYLEVAHIQKRLGKIELAKKAVIESLTFNPNNKSSQNFLTDFEINNTTKQTHIEINTEEFNIALDKNENLVSSMLLIDLQEYEYRDEEIIELGGKPDTLVAKRLFEQAKNSRKSGIELSERYPIYLETAKAFNDLPTGSNVDAEFREALAYYAMLKGNSLFVKFKDEILNTNKNNTMLSRLKDSACSYYIESLNLLEELIEGTPILSSLANVLKLQITYSLFRKGYTVSREHFKGVFSEVFANSLTHEDKDIEKIAFETIIALGAASKSTWNKLHQLKGGTGYLYNQNKNKIYSNLNKIEHLDLGFELKPAVFFTTIFDNRRNKNESLKKTSQILEKTMFSIENISTIKQKWEEIKTHQNLLTDTDIEIVKSLDKAIALYEPYKSRGNEERTRILRDVRVILEEQLKFVLENTTYWGRVAFYSIIVRWQADLKKVESERYEHTIPQIKATIDPDFIQQDATGSYFSILLKNEGVATAGKVLLEYNLKSLVSSYKINQEKYNFEEEIAVNEAKSVRINVPNQETVIELVLNITAYYQNEALPTKDFNFTIQKKTEAFNLNQEDIPWNETRTPIELLFKGREELLNELVKHYKSLERDKSYILYGLTRTGKSSILKYFGEKIDKELVKIDAKNYQFISFNWGFEEANNQHNAEDTWEYLLQSCLLNKLKQRIADKSLPCAVLPYLNNKLRFKDWKLILEHLKKQGYMPIFLIDEFSYYKDLADKKRLEASFLAAIRQYTFDGLASFLFAGTYDIKELIKNPHYGITGQLVNLKEKIVSQIDTTFATELIEVIKDKLVFTEEAIKYILSLSNCVPYFIQILCKYCALYAVEQQKRYLGFPEVELVTKILTGEETKPKNSVLGTLSEGVFMNNQDTPTDAQHIKVLVSTIADINRGKSKPRGVGYAELQEIWGKQGITNYRPLLLEALDYLKSKEILTEKIEENETVYYIGVDLFRRFWCSSHQDITTEFDSLKELN